MRSVDMPVECRLSDLVGLPVTLEGNQIGRLVDMTAHLGATTPPVGHFLVRTKRSVLHLVTPDDVSALSSTGVVLHPGAQLGDAQSADVPLGSHEVLLRRDVLDTQVVDLRGHRLSRVSDVLLHRRGNDLGVQGVDLGAAGLARRIGLARLVRGRPSLAIPWSDLHLTSRRGHTVQLSTDAAAFRRLDAHNLAALLPHLSPRHAADVVRAVDPPLAAAALHHSHPRTGRRLVRALSTHEHHVLVEAAAEEHTQTVADLGRPLPPLRSRRFLRTAGWRRHRPPGSTP